MTNTVIDKTINRFKAFFSLPIFANVFVFLTLTFICFYLYAGFKSIFYAITQDYIAIYAGSRFILSHPSFAFMMSFPHFVPLLYPFFFIVQCLTHDTQWLNVTVSLSLHIVNAFMLFKIAQIFCRGKLLPALVASLFYLVSLIHIDTLLCFAHAYPVVTSFFGLLSAYFFSEVIRAGERYERKQLFLAFLFYLLSISSGLNFIGLAPVYFLIMLIRIRYFKKDFIYMFGMVLSFFIVFILLRNFIRPVYKIDVAPISFSAHSLMMKMKNFEYSFLHLVSLFFPGFPLTLASFLVSTSNVLEDAGYYHEKFYRIFSIFMLFIPLVFSGKEKKLKLYSLWALIFLLFFPYLFSPKGLNSRHLSQTVAASSLFLGLLFCNVFDSFCKVKTKILRFSLNLLLILFSGIFFLKYTQISRGEVKKYISYNSSFSPFIRKFTEEFSKIRVNNEKKQIYFLKAEIPGEYSFFGGGGPDYHCYYFFHLAVKYKNLPVDLYAPVYADLDIPKTLSKEYLRNFFISLPNGNCFGLYRDRDKLIKLINSNPGVSKEDVVVLNWQDGLLKQEHLEM